MEGLEWENIHSKSKNLSDLRVKNPSSTAQVQNYSVSVSGNTRSLKDFYSTFKNTPQELLSNSKATFHNPVDGKGNNTTTDVGAYIGIDIKGPFNDGYVKVTDASKSNSGFSFTFTTLEGHVENGSITFSVNQTKEGLNFNINSKSDISQGAAKLLSGFARSEQVASWQEVLNKFVDMSGGQKTDTSTKVEDRSSNFFKSYIDETFKNLNEALKNK